MKYQQKSFSVPMGGAMWPKCEAVGEWGLLCCEGMGHKGEHDFVRCPKCGGTSWKLSAPPICTECGFQPPREEA